MSSSLAGLLAKATSRIFLNLEERAILFSFLKSRLNGCIFTLSQ
jgi:hypothetical protein